MKFGFNKWELAAEGGDTASLAPTSISRNMGSDFWSCWIKVPEDSFELNFVLNDGEGRYENNSNQDFTYPVEGEWQPASMSGTFASSNKIQRNTDKRKSWGVN